MLEAEADTDLWRGLAPAFSWRPSQRRLLESALAVPAAKRHIVAPPGAGKTLIGLELARRAGARTLVLAPTVAIRDQWRRSVAMFGADPESFTAGDPAAGRPLTCVTYQLLGDPGEASGAVTGAARRLWLARVASSTSPEEAEARVGALEKRDPDRARRELAREVRRLRRSLATGEDVGVAYRDLLGPRTLALVDLLADQGVGCVVLDECHHLLDWWALVVAALLSKLRRDPAGRGVALVGLTATPPDPASEVEERNYRGLLGDVDAELPLPAVVGEGGVARWRDGVHLETLTEAESAFLDDWGRIFAGELDGWLTGEACIGWAVGRLLSAALDDRAAAAGSGDSDGDGAGGGLAGPVASGADRVGAAEWSDFWDRDPLLGAALLRWWTARGLSLPVGFDPPPGAGGALSLDDRLTLIDAWIHDPVNGPEPPVREEIDRCAGRHGVSFTAAGFRWGRSVADIVCARSAAKGAAAADILAREEARRGQAMKALVAVELDVAAAPPAEARRVLGEDPGTAARVTAALCGDHRVLPLGVVTVTGRGMWADAVGAERYCDAINIGSAAPDRWVTTEGCDIAGAVRIVGRGPGWTPARWLRAATDALGPGGAQVMVATRGLVGEGWDHPPVNVLVDLSEGTSPAAATQLRGRALRINPVEPDKIASLWDVAVVHGAAPGDWERLRRRHQHWWGPDGAGRIVTGPAKLHPRLGRPAVPEPHELDLLNEASAAAVADLDRTRAAWAAVEPGGAGASVVHVRRSRLRRQVSTRATVEKRRHRVRAGGGVAVGGLAGGVGGALFYRPLAGLIVIGALAGTGLAASTKVPGRDAELRRLRALGRGVLAGLGAIGAGQASTAQVEVDVDAEGTLSVRIDGAGDQLATVWADAVSEMLGPLGTPRWIVVAAGEAWRVPAVVGPTRDAAEAFRSAFARHVRGAVLVRAGTPEATALVLADAGRRTEPVDRSRRWGR